MIENGYVHDVRLVTLGSFLDGAHLTGSTTLKIMDAADFNEEGGSFILDGLTLAYVSADMETDTLTLVSPLAADYEDGVPLYITPLSYEKQAVVVLDGFDEAITAIVPHSLYDRLPDGIREDSARESVTIELENATWLVKNVYGKEPVIDGQYLENVVADDILDGIVTTVKLANDAVTQAKMATGAIGNDELINAAVDAAKLASDAVTTAAIASDAVTNDKVAPNAIGNTELAANAVTANKIAAGTITADKLTIGFGSNLVADPSFEGAYTAALVSGNAFWSVDATKGNGSAKSLKVDATSGSAATRTLKLMTIPVTAGEQYYLSYVYNASSTYVGTPKFYATWKDSTGTTIGWGVAEATVPVLGGSAWTPITSTVTVPTNAVSADVAVESFNGTAGQLWFDTVVFKPVLPGTSIADGVVTTNKIAANAVTAGKILAGEIGATHLAAGAVTAGKIAASAIQAGNIAAGAIQTGDIAANAITTAKLAALSVTANELATNAVTASKILAGAITADKLDAAAITGKTITGGTITGTTINGGSLTIGPTGLPQAVVSSDSSAGRLTFPTNRTSEGSTSKVSGVVLNKDLANEYLSLQLQGPATSNASANDRINLLISSQNLDGTSNANLGVSSANNGLLIAVDSDKVQVQRKLIILPSGTASGMDYFYVGAPSGADTSSNLIQAVNNGGNRFQVKTTGQATINKTGNAAGIPLTIIAESGQTGDLIDVQVGASSKLNLDAAGNLTVPGKVTASGGYATPMIKRRTTDLSRTTTTLAIDPTLQFTVLANTTYILTGWIKYSSDGTGDINFDWTVPSGCLGEWSGIGMGLSIGTIQTSNGYSLRTEANDVAQARGFGAVVTSSGDTTPIPQTVLINGCVRVQGTGGTYGLNWAQRDSSGSVPTIVYTDSWLRLEPCP